MAILGVITYVALPVYAFDEPTQSTDNATDVILWYGENQTISVAGNVTLSTVPITWSSNLTVTGIPELNDTISTVSENIIDELETINASFIILALLFFVTILAYWHRDKILYVVAGLLFIVTGFGFSTTIVSDMMLLEISLVITGIAIVFKAFKKDKKEE